MPNDFFRFPQRTASCLFWSIFQNCTFFAGGPSVCRECAVTHVAGALFHTPAPVVADAGRAAAVTRTARAHTRGRLGSLVQVKGHAVHIKRSHAAQKASLSGSCSSCSKESTLVNRTKAANSLSYSRRSFSSFRLDFTKPSVSNAMHAWHAVRSFSLLVPHMTFMATRSVASARMQNNSRTANNKGFLFSS